MPDTMITRSGASALIPEPVAREIIQGVVAESAVLSMGRRLPNMTSSTQGMNVLDLLPEAAFVNGEAGDESDEQGYKHLSAMKWKRKRLVAEEIAVIIPIHENVLDDADYDVWGEVKPRAIEAAGKTIDGAVLFGVNKPSTWRDDILTTATQANAVKNIGSDLYQDIFGVGGTIAMVEENGFDVNGIMAATQMRAQLRGLTDNAKRPLFLRDMQSKPPYTLDGVGMSFPKNGAFDPSKALAIFGDFDQLVYSFRQDVTYKLLTEATLVDPVTKQVLYSLAQQDMVALRITMRLGWEIPNPVSAFNAHKAESQRCPFSVLAP